MQQHPANYFSLFLSGKRLLHSIHRSDSSLHILKSVILSEPLICYWILFSCLFVPSCLFSELCFFFSLFSIYKWLSVSLLPTHLCLPGYFPFPFCLTSFAPYPDFPHFLHLTDQSKRNKLSFQAGLRSSTNNPTEHILRNKFHLHLHEPEWYNINQNRVRKIKLSRFLWIGMDVASASTVKNTYCIHSFATFWPQAADGILSLHRPQFP